MISASEILKASILVVDDQEADVSLLEQLLRGAGYTSIASTMDPHEVCELQRKIGGFGPDLNDLPHPFPTARVLVHL